MLKLTFLAPLFFFLFGSQSVWAQSLCLSSDNDANAIIRVRFVMPSAGGKGGDVRYENGWSDIPVVRVKEVALGKGVPAVVKATYNEIFNGKLSGHYVVISQGGAIGEVLYSRVGSRKVFKFSDDQSAYEGDRCAWEK